MKDLVQRVVCTASVAILVTVLGFPVSASAAKEQVSLQQYTDAVAGNTAVSKNGKWVVYYREDGQKMMSFPKIGEKTILKWWKDDQGLLCDEQYSDDGKASCIADTQPKITRKKKKKGYLYKMQTSSGKTHNFYVLEGNSEGL